MRNFGTMSQLGLIPKKLVCTLPHATVWSLFFINKFFLQTYVVVSVCVAMRTGCACGLAMGPISVGLSMYSVSVAQPRTVHVHVGMSRARIPYTLFKTASGTPVMSLLSQRVDGCVVGTDFERFKLTQPSKLSWSWSWG